MPDSPEDQPVPDTSDLRVGVPVHDRLLALLPLVGVWRGAGTGVVASTGAEFGYGQQISFVHDGRPFLAYEARSWLTDADGKVIRPAWRESGFWRPGPGQDDVEAVIASNTGQALQFVGVAGDQRWDVHSISVVPTPTARPVDGERRLYAIVDEQLVYASELAPAGQQYAPHLNARLSRMPAAASRPDRG
jgi:hypothetical protein